MAGLLTDPLAVGEAALAAGDWTGAREAFEAALAEADTPAAHDGLGRALWWLEGAPKAVTERVRAYSGYHRAGDESGAAHVAVWVAHEYVAGLANPAAASGWLARAAGLLERLPEGPDHAPGARARPLRGGPAAGRQPREGRAGDRAAPG
jgi:hypothetical protein